MKIIDAHLHFWPGHGHFDELALEAGHENTAGHLKTVYQDLDISFGIVMGNRGLSPKEHEYPGFLRYCIGVDRGYLKDHSLTETYDLLEEISADLSAKLSRTAVNSSYGFRFTLDNRTWTKGDNVSYVVSKVSSLALLSLVADGVAGAMRQKEMANKTPDILRSIGRQYISLRASVDQAVESVYGKLGENAKKQLAEYYGEKIRAAQEQVEQSAMVARQDEERKEQIREAVAEIRRILGQIQKELEGEG